MKLPEDMQKFLRNGANKEMLFNLIEVALKEGKKKIGDKVIYFSNVNHCLKITQHEAFIVTEKSSDHEEADTKLVALVKAANIANGKTVMIRSPSGDIDIIVLFILHEFDGITILIDNGVGKSRKIIDMSTSLLCQQKRKALAAVHAFSGNDYVSSFFRKGKKVMWKLVLQNDKFLDAFSQLGLFNSVTDEVSNCLEKFMCALYSYKNETTVNNVRVKMFQMKGISDLALLPPCKDNLKLHISRANYVANMYLNAIELHRCLDDPIYHRWKQCGTVQWRDDCFPENINDVLETFDRKDYDYVSEYKFTDDEISNTSDSER